MKEDSLPDRAVIVSRVSCYRCSEIVEFLEGKGIPSEVKRFHDGGAAFLAEHGYLPQRLPTTFLFRGTEVVLKADGLSEFYEKWEAL